MNANPNISVIMPVRNGELFVADAIKSIQTQSVAVTEIHVINDGSTDATAEIVSALARTDSSIIVHDGPQKGPGPARNVGLRRATGEVIAFLDSDDLWPAGKLQTQVARLVAKPDVSMVSGFVLYFDKQIENGLEPASDARTSEIFHVHLGATIYRRNVFDEVGLFDETFTYSEDVDLMLRIREASLPFTIMNEITLYYRRHDNSMTTTLTTTEKRDFHRSLINSLKRRKAAGITEPLTPFADVVGF
ncbi:glycosyltransferase [Anderseniella sp. Alg231-50]|uniref:glycosyltransferase n=1 Tax=Anderseniella sp. Alg231-50 TaxID=1922226 RepID=UPI000D555E5D